MAQPTIYDVMLKDKKVGGAAQRKTSAGFLHQATISLKLPPISFLQDVLQQSECLISAMQQTTYSFLSADSTQAEMDAFRYQLEIILQEEIVKIH
jgi:lipoate-protein ligase A